ncbi:MAG: hypothetical protein WD669_03660 [Pirellulales bacterium]
MNRLFLIVLLVAAFLIVGLGGNVPAALADGLCGECLGCNCLCSSCVCGDFCCGCCDCGYMLPAKRGQGYNWNGRYAHSAYGQPVALLVPPIANMQTNWGWGVSSSRVSHLDHQVHRNYPGAGLFGGWWRRTPAWPSDTTQIGAYYVRGPW